MSAHEEGTEGSSSMSRPSLIDPNIYVLSEAIRSSMENSMVLLSATMQENALVMGNTIWEGFAAHPSIEGTPNTRSKKRAQKILEHTTGPMICKNVQQKLPHYGCCITADFLFSAIREGMGDQITKIHDFSGLGFQC